MFIVRDVSNIIKCVLTRPLRYVTVLNYTSILIMTQCPLDNNTALF